MIVYEALAYLERLEAESEGDESLDLELSRAYRQIGFIQGNPNTANLGNREEALKQYEKARRLALPLGLKSDASAGAISNLVSVDMAIADLVKRRSGIEAGAVFTQEAVEQAQRVVRISASSRESRTLLGRALFAQAILYNPGAASIPHWERARDHYEQDLAAHPDDREHQRNVALVCKYLGGVLETMGDYPASLKLQRRALELDERRYLADPGNRTTQFDFAVSLSSVATAMEHAGKDDEAAALYSRSLDIRQGLSDSDPKDVLALSKTGYVKMRLALVEIELGHVRTGARACAVVGGDPGGSGAKNQRAECAEGTVRGVVHAGRCAGGSRARNFLRALRPCAEGIQGGVTQHVPGRNAAAGRASQSGVPLGRQGRAIARLGSLDRERHAVATAKTQ